MNQIEMGLKIMKRLQRWTFTTVPVFAGLMIISLSPASALPSYSRQTGDPCTACHVGGFGPQLTPHGRDFKITGYSDAKDNKFRPPVSAMLVGNFTHTRKKQEEKAGPHDGRNNNWALQEASIFVAGKIIPHMGTFVQTTYSEIDHHTAFDNADVRYARTLGIHGKDLVVGIDFNNNPTVQDPFNTVGSWSFPYTASDLVPGSVEGAFINGGLEHQVVGSSAYMYFDKHIYAEVGGYRSIKHNTLHWLGIEDEAGKLKGVAPYWRVAYNREWHGQSASLGLIGLNGSIHPGREPGRTNKYRDIGIDASYQYLGNRKNIFSFNASYIWEKQKLDYDYYAEETKKRRHHLNQSHADISWYHDNSYGLTLGLFNTTGSRDPDRFVPEPDSGSRTGSPKTRGYIAQADWTPFGKEGSWAAPWVNLRLGVQYTGYTKFNGSKRDYDGYNRKASANNTVMLFAWLAF